MCTCLCECVCPHVWLCVCVLACVQHIFCEDCVSTWFSRERTCPMCRANIVDTPQWRDGATCTNFQIYWMTCIVTVAGFHCPSEYMYGKSTYRLVNSCEILFVCCNLSVFIFRVFFSQVTACWTMPHKQRTVKDYCCWYCCAAHVHIVWWPTSARRHPKTGHTTTTPHYFSHGDTTLHFKM